ncbi:hypothetical protein [Micromonospora chokoriensis]|uniref:hypothetical protein n=1 Tax=Micromonospora chokoriensis TaxID=356851 RepID=UPI0012FD8AF8|nr:hypothetical protein [Micromonospora chokoriensis]
MTSVACVPWRIAWAERENERRQRAYRDATDAWRRRDDHLARLRVEAASFLGCTQPRTGLPVDLADDELVFRVLPVATLVEAEARHVPGLPTPGGSCSFAEAWSEALPPGLRAVDTGMAVVTSHRVAFGGREHRREWRYANLVGPAHHPDTPFTLLPDHSRLAGLLVPASAVVNFRFYLTLAVATDRAAVLTQVDALLAAHRAARPAPVMPADPDDAPLTAVRPDRRALGAAAIAAVVFATVGPGALGPNPHLLASEPVPQAQTIALDVPRAGVVLVPTVPVGPVAPRSRVGSADSAVWSPPQAPAVRPSTAAAISRVVSPAVTVAVAPAVTPSAVPAVSPTSVPTPGPTTEPSTSAVPTPPVASTSPTPTPTATPSPNSLLAVCLDPLQLPLLDPLLCPPPTP